MENIDVDHLSVGRAALNSPNKAKKKGVKHTEPFEPTRKVAILIGCADINRASCPELPFTEATIDALEEKLIQFGFDVESNTDTSPYDA